MIDFTRKERYDYADMVRLIHLLRSPGGCPWDQAQTHQSIRRCFLEETYEVLEAMDQDDPAHMCEELGDVLTQVVFHGTMEQDAGRFTMDDIYDGVCKKMILRHPFLFDGSAENPGADSAFTSWEAIKRVEKGQKTHTEVLEAVPKTLPGTWRAEKLQKKAGKAGFFWENPRQALDKLLEEAQELREALDRGQSPDEELGDLLFAAVNVSTSLDRDPEDALHGACEKFVSRFSRMESSSLVQGRPLDDLPREELLQLWNAAKETGGPSA